MITKAQKLEEILKERGVGIHFQYGGEVPKEVVEREIKLELTPRAAKLRDLYYRTLSSASTEFPYWYTRKYDEENGEVQVVRRAKALAHAYAHTTPVIYPGELLVGTKTPFYRGAFPMPWLTESFYLANEDEFKREAKEAATAAIDNVAQLGSGGGNVTKSFGNVVALAGKFGMRAEEVPVMTKLAETWINRSIEDISNRYEQLVPEYELKVKLLKTLVELVDSGYSIPQGREIASYYYPLEYGFDGIIGLCEQRKKEVAGKADGDGILGMERLYFYEAATIVLKGVQKWMHNYVAEASRLASSTKDAKQKKEYEEIANCMEWVAHKQPRTFREALQLAYFLHIAILNEDPISGFSPGRLGQVLWPWFEQDIAADRITEAEVLELLECYRVKMTCIEVFASSGVNGSLSGNTFNNLCVGGLNREGQPFGNRLEWLIIHAGMTCQTPQPTLSVLYHDSLPMDFLLKCAECTKTGAGYPAWMNFNVGQKFIMNQYQEEGMTIQESMAFSIGGCLETATCSWKTIHLNGKKYEIPTGSSQPTSVGVHFINNPAIINLVLFNGKDLRTGSQVFPPNNKELITYQEFWTQYKEYYNTAVDVLVKCNNIQHDIWRKHNMSILNALSKPDCLSKGHHTGNMGIRYNATYNIESCGTINMVNALATLKKLIYDDKKYTLEEMKEALANNFGFIPAEVSRNYSLGEQLKNPDIDKYDEIFGDCLRAPKYGNDDAYVDNILQEYERWFCEFCRTFESLYARKMYACQISVAIHGVLGLATLATPDGRLANTTFADGSMSAYPGTDRNGPYALFKSATCWDHSQSQNSQLNMKIHPNAIMGKAGTKRLLELISAYMKQGGFHIQFNIVDSKMLKDAQYNPVNYRDLLVRVSGFTQYWVEIGKPVQDEVIARTEYESV